jgi:hypothetical protein
VGATFDPGPEFARSTFKYERHPEISQGNAMGKGTFVSCYALLHEDKTAYAAYPNGIPEGTPFSVFFGKQSQRFLGDLGFDYLWLSNGFGYGLEPWNVTGDVFDGKTFDTGRISEVSEKILGFWKGFREGCPGYPLETRGTNLSTGMDLSGDGVSLRDIYRGGFNLEPPPNSPWAALNGDYGLEMVGYMSRIAELPGESYPFRFYTHDPWWLNSPWLDRYGREPHDIYLPMSVARIDSTGMVRQPTSIEFLTIDDSFGNMPEQVPNEVIPHVLAARADAPDAPGPIVWVCPFDEYHDMTFAAEPRVGEVFFGDWFMRQAVNMGFPANTIISTGNLLRVLSANPTRFDQSILVSIVPDAGAELEKALLQFVGSGGRVLLYGPLDHASKTLLTALNVTLADPMRGEMAVDLRVNIDTISGGSYPATTKHDPLMCAGGIRATLRNADDAATQVYAAVSQGESRRVVALARTQPGEKQGTLAWVRGTNSNFFREGAQLLLQDDPDKLFAAENLMRLMLHAFGYDFAVTKDRAGVKAPLVCVARHKNGFFFSGYNADTLADLGLRFPQGAPVLIGYETRLVNGRSTYTMPRAWHRECRIFVDGQREGALSCVEQHSGQYGVTRRIRVTGLMNATVRIYAPPDVTPETIRCHINAGYPYKEGRITPAVGEARLGSPFELRNVTGSLVVAW